MLQSEDKLLSGWLAWIDFICTSFEVIWQIDTKKPSEGNLQSHANLNLKLYWA